MSDTVPQKRPPAPAPRKAPRGSGEGSSTLPPLSVRYYRRMRPQRVYPVVVRWKGGRAGEAGTHPLEVRLLGGGSQIVPSEFTLDPSKPDKTATFYLTPLALGPLRGARVEVLNQGRKVQEIPLLCKTVGQRGTLVLLLLTFLVPWLLAALKHSPPIEYWYEAKFGEQKVLLKKNMTSGEALQLRLDKEIPPVNEWLHQNMFPVSQVLTSLTAYLGQIYDVIYHGLSQEPEALPEQPTVLDHAYHVGHSLAHYAPYYAFWILLLLTLWSFLRTQEKRTRIVAPALELPAATAPVAARQVAAAGAEPGA
jgi:hypothetical protein